MDMKKRIIRVFPTKTNATPTDELVRIRETPSFFDEADEVHVSVTFTWDIPIAEWLAKQWEPVATVKIGGPAYNEPGGDFIPGMYMRHGYVITSRGCPNRCWFCAVPKREGGMLRELPVTDGWILTDDNLLACSPGHIDEVFAMLARQPHKPQFTGGLEAALLTPTMAQRIHELHPQSLFFAYDTPNDLDPLVEAGKMLIEAGFTKSSNSMRCYVFAVTRETRSRKHRHGWARRGEPVLCQWQCCFVILRVNIQPIGAGFNGNGPIRQSRSVTV